MVAYTLALGCGRDKLLTEVIPVTIFAGFLDNDLLVVVRKLVDDVLDLLIELQLVEFGDAVLRDLDTGISISLV